MQIFVVSNFDDLKFHCLLYCIDFHGIITIPSSPKQVEMLLGLFKHFKHEHIAQIWSDAKIIAMIKI